MTLLSPPYRAEPSTSAPVITESTALPPPVPVSGVPVHPVGVDTMLAWVHSTVARGARGRISYANAHNVLLAAKEPLYRQALEQSDVVFCDGYGVWGASRWLGTPLPERMTLPDWSERLFAMADAQGWPLFFLGGVDGVAQRAAEVLRGRYPSLEISVHHGYFHADGPENEAVLESIRAARPVLLLVGMGPPRQEIWIAANHDCHDAALAFAVGCLFDYIAGTITRGPRWLTRGGGEWLWRLVREPRRLWRRYLLGNPRFIWHILRGRNGP